MGLYDEVSPFGEPSYAYNFTHFGYEDIIRVQPEPAPGEESAGEGGNDEGDGAQEDPEEPNDGLYEWCP